MMGNTMSRGFRAVIIGVFLLSGASFSYGDLVLDKEAPARVSGAIQAVEPERSSIIVDGRRFQLAAEVSLDGITVSSERALTMLSEGNEVTLLDVESSYDQVTRIRTRLR